jgi:hypothetical protein
MRKLGVLAAVVGGLIAGASPASAEHIWVGDGTTVSEAACHEMKVAMKAQPEVLRVQPGGYGCYLQGGSWNYYYLIWV